MKTNKPTVIDNFLSQQELDRLKSEIQSPDFLWLFAEDAVDYSDDEGREIYSQYVNVMYAQDIPFNNYFGIVMDMFADKIPGFRTLIRLKSNLITKREENHITGYHIDFKDFDGSYSGIFYLNTTNAPTLFKDGDKVDCVENRFVLFPMDTMHSSTTQTDEDFRIVLNFNWF
jgi:hypothetical protein